MQHETERRVADLHMVKASQTPAGRNSRGAGFKVALVGTFAPRKCGIATFTTDIHDNLRIYHPEMDVDVYALDDGKGDLAYSGVSGLIRSDDPASYAATARAINASGADAVWLQHEYGIFGGDSGDMACDFVDRVAAPLILTFHTVLRQPTAKQEEIMRHLIGRASRIMVMSSHSRDLLTESYGAPNEIIEIIEHGAPDRPFGRQAQFKEALGLAPDRPVMMTFGLLGPGKGIGQVIEGLPAIARDHPDILYRIVGATHPNLVARDGEAYRESLIRRAEELGVSHCIAWENRFLDTGELLDQLEACDIYVTPYLNLQQSTSGTLSYAVALGKAVVSTPYLHASELLSDGVGLLIEPDSPAAIVAAVKGLLAEPQRLERLQRRAYAKGRETIWPRFADATAGLIVKAAARNRSVSAAGRQGGTPAVAAPGMSAVLGMTDGTGIAQHALGIVPDRRHGYCIDDNARALMVANVATRLPPDERLRLSQTYASFIQHAWNEDAGRFRNFMSYDRKWCEDIGSEDSNGRALWALGHTIENADFPEIRDWAVDLYGHVLPHIAELDSLRAISFTMLGAAAMLRHDAGHAASRDVLERGSAMMVALLGHGRRPDWTWFETMLAYDNPRISQALIEAAAFTGDEIAGKAGLETLRWINDRQTSAGGHFRPIGSESFGRKGEFLPFDQQPLEASAAIDALRAAYSHTGDGFYRDAAERTWQWFFGRNDRGVVLADPASGRCRDGITPRGANANCGAESILAFQLSCYSMIALSEDPRQQEAGQQFDEEIVHIN